MDLKKEKATVPAPALDSRVEEERMESETTAQAAMVLVLEAVTVTAKRPLHYKHWLLTSTFVLLDNLGTSTDQRFH